MTQAEATSAIVLTDEQLNVVKSGSFEDAVNKALAPYKVKFNPELGTVSKMIKESDAYKAIKVEADRRTLVNDVKAILKAFHVGEYMILWSAAKGYWARLNGVAGPNATDKKNGNLNVRQVNLSMVRGDIAASPTEKNLAAVAKQHQLEAELAKARADRDAFQKALAENGITIDVETTIVSTE